MDGMDGMDDNGAARFVGERLYPQRLVRYVWILD
jgi:hypothetical protein